MAKISGVRNVVRMKNSLVSSIRTLNQVTNQIRRMARMVPIGQPATAAARAASSVSEVLAMRST